MSDLPERIAVKKLSGMLTLDSVNEPIWPDAPTTIYLRADLAVGFTREQIEALRIKQEPTSSAMLDEYIKGYNHAIYDILDEEPALTPAAEVPVPMEYTKIGYTRHIPGGWSRIFQRSETDNDVAVYIYQASRDLTKGRGGV